MPEFDNLYLDMNGIIHPCTHGDDGAQFKLTEDQMFINIGKFIDELMKVVKPQQLLFLAVDGCAPRAKMNQQRQRRFRAAQEQSKALMQAKQRGEEVPAEPFDSNCITPGTRFMARLTEYLHYFIRAKIKDDPNWSRPQIILSGAEVPGEGEHKIMEYIRREKSQPGWAPNQRHCIYGNDADLIMLSLATHEPHFALLRETTDFRPPRRNRDGTAPPLSKVDKEQKNRSKGFQLLHVSVLRDYIQLEFRELEGEMTEWEEPLDLERLIDDFVMLCYLIGNDFLPHLPALDILTGALNDLLAIYKSLLPTWDDYLTAVGEIDLGKLGQVLQRIGEDIEEKVLSAEVEEEAALGLEDGLDNYKRSYYVRKFGLQPEDTAGHRSLQQKYVEGLLWCYSYYYNGCVSWGWFYPYHHTPFASDLQDLENMEIQFEMGNPFLPFQQLLGVLPIASRKLLPEAYACLMDSPLSALNQAGFYPLDFEIDMEGKKMEWEAIALIPFIDADLLRQEHDKVDARLLAPEDAVRNAFGKNRRFVFDNTVTDSIPSPMAYLPDVACCCSRLEEYTWPEFLVELGGRFMPVLCEGVDQTTAGFPGLFSAPPGGIGGNVVPDGDFKVDYEIRNCRVTIFGRPSSRDSIVLKLPQSGQKGTAEGLTGIVGKKFWVEWPYMQEVQVKCVSDAVCKLTHTGGGVKKVVWAPDESSRWVKEAAFERDTWMSKRGLDVGNVCVMLEVQGVESVLATALGGVTKTYSSKTRRVPLNLCSAAPPSLDPRFVEAPPAPLPDRYPKGAKVLCMRSLLMGQLGLVEDCSEDRVTVSVTLTPKIRMEEERFGERLAAAQESMWVRLEHVAGRLRMRPALLSKLTTSLLIKGADLGLGIKFDKKGYAVPGYARKDADGGWQLSTAALEALSEYRDAFPALVQALGGLTVDARDVDAKTLLPNEADAAGYVGKVVEWIKKHPLSRLPLLPVTAQALGAAAIMQIQECADAFVKMQEEAVSVPKKEALRANEVLLPQPNVTAEQLAQGAQVFNCGDRVVSAVAGGPVPLGARGTVVAVEEADVDVLLDKTLLTANSLGNRCGDLRGYKMKQTSLLNVSANAPLPGSSHGKASKPPQTQSNSWAEGGGARANVHRPPERTGGGRG
eukprot:CAMPEP_0177725258 /NCGR_PEP_ID=MMETSP0484_2-20121128/19154_1 /TAXON_ID=354590 /ORGANISM="Rhodomonas lens, Strain RHODO" /LENGTH=1134 /DNA_ID=CAMNT_0019237757 /DNA_START=456 /DNA_END=3857 /DNA_ORIENTATION=+